LLCEATFWLIVAEVARATALVGPRIESLCATRFNWLNELLWASNRELLFWMKVIGCVVKAFACGALSKSLAGDLLL